MLARRFASFVALLAGAISLHACVEFAEPVIPDRRAPAVGFFNMRVFDNGVLQVDGSLSPGRDSVGFQRAVLSPFIRVNTFNVEPTAVTEQGQRTYGTVFPIPRATTIGPWELNGPEVAGVGQLPRVLWGGIRKLDPDTLRVVRGDDIVLNMDTAAVQAIPTTRFRQWFIDIRAGTQSFRLSGDGPVPLRLRIPAEFIPPSPNNLATISMLYLQTASVSAPTGLYVANVTLDARLTWIVVFRTTP